MAFLELQNHKFEIIKYLDNPLTFNELSEIIKKLKIKPIELIRSKESIWINNYKGKKLSDKEIIQTIVDHPILMERPIAVNGSKAVIARPFDRLKQII